MYITHQRRIQQALPGAKCEGAHVNTIQLINLLHPDCHLINSCNHLSISYRHDPCLMHCLHNILEKYLLLFVYL